MSPRVCAWGSLCVGEQGIRTGRKGGDRDTWKNRRTRGERSTSGWEDRMEGMIFTLCWAEAWGRGGEAGVAQAPRRSLPSPASNRLPPPTLFLSLPLTHTDTHTHTPNTYFSPSCSHSFISLFLHCFLLSLSFLLLWSPGLCSFCPHSALLLCFSFPFHFTGPCSALLGQFCLPWFLP